MATLAATCALSSQCAVFAPRPRAVQRARVVRPVHASLHTAVTEIARIADAAPGTVNAPVGYIVAGAVIVTLASFAISAGLKPGEGH